MYPELAGELQANLRPRTPCGWLMDEPMARGASLEHQPGVHRVSLEPGLLQAAANDGGTVAGGEAARVFLPASEQGLLFVVGKERHDGGPCRRDAERESDSFMQHEGADGEAPFLPEDAHSFLATENRIERTLPRLFGEAPKAGTGNVLEREARRSHCTQKEDFRSQDPVAGVRIVIPSGFLPTTRSRAATRRTTWVPCTF